MNNILFRPFNESDAALVKSLIKDLYKGETDEQSGELMTDEKVALTFNRFILHPDNGSILVFETNHQVVGYAILLNFWSNEYGGMIIYLDELYVIPAYRSQGIASQFIKYLKDSKPPHCVGIRLEVLRYNTRALALYEQMGFKKMDRDFMMLAL